MFKEATGTILWGEGVIFITQDEFYDDCDGKFYIDQKWNQNKKILNKLYPKCKFPKHPDLYLDAYLDVKVKYIDLFWLSHYKSGCSMHYIYILNADTIQ